MNGLIGAARLAIGRADGMARFRDTTQAYLASLAPLIAFPLVGALLLAAAGYVTAGALMVLLALVGQLTPPVLSYWIAKRWGREAEWLRFSTAFNWCQWAIVPAFIAILVVVEVATVLGMPEAAGAVLLMAGVGLYGLWLHWTVARYGLALSWGRSALLVLVVNGVTMLMTARLTAVLLRSLPLIAVPPG